MNDLEKALAKGDAVSLCVGLKMKDDGVRQEAAKKLSDFNGNGAKCICEHLVRDGVWDKAVLDGLAHAKRDDRVGCTTRLLDDPVLTDRPGLVTELLRIEAPSVRARMVQAVKSDKDPDVRAAAIGVFAGTKDTAEISILTEGLGTDPDAKWRWAAASALAGIPSGVEALSKAAASDADGTVRATAITALRGQAPFADAACAGLKDADPIVRSQAALAMKGSKDEKALTCLASHMMEVEADETVRLAMLTGLRSSPSPIAANALCDAIPFWIKNYVGDTQVQREGAADIIFAQNDRDYQRSYECVQKAMHGSGYSCWGKAYVADYMRELGGNAPLPRCGPQKVIYSGGNEINF